jgi:hypothetical protein
MLFSNEIRLPVLDVIFFDNTFWFCKQNKKILSDAYNK